MSMSASGFAAPAKPAVKPAPRKMMVPPPPPEVSLMGAEDPSQFLTMGVSLQFMGRAELDRMRLDLQKKLSNWQKKADETSSTLALEKTRLQEFDGLFKEGVISKKDLSNLKKEVVASEENLVDVEQTLSQLKTDLSRVEKRLAALDKKNQKPAVETRKKR